MHITHVATMKSTCGTEFLCPTPGSDSVSTIRAPLGVDRKISGIATEWFSHFKYMYLDHLASNWEIERFTCFETKLGVHNMQQALRKAESGDHKHTVNDT